MTDISSLRLLIVVICILIFLSCYEAKGFKTTAICRMRLLCLNFSLTHLTFNVILESILSLFYDISLFILLFSCLTVFIKTLLFIFCCKGFIQLNLQVLILTFRSPLLEFELLNITVIQAGSYRRKIGFKRYDSVLFLYIFSFFFLLIGIKQSYVVILIIYCYLLILLLHELNLLAIIAIFQTLI